MYESAFERKLCKYIKSIGGIAYKWVSPGISGVPDRIVILPKGQIIFIEVKRPGISEDEGLSIRQKKVRATLEELGCTVWCISNVEDLKERLTTYGV